MKKKQHIFYTLGGVVLGILLTTALWMCAGLRANTAFAAGSPTQDPLAAILVHRAASLTQEQHVSITTDTAVSRSQPVHCSYTSLSTDDSDTHDAEISDFKVVGYYPSWKPAMVHTIDFGVVTHVCYAFAIPMADGSLRDLDNPNTARALIRSAHANNAKILLSVGGWSYNGTLLEGVFMEATSTDEGVKRLADNIIAMCENYGFDGVDMDWEHPRTDGTSSKQYEALMLELSGRLHSKGKLLTAAVLSGATADGSIYYDAAAHTDQVLNAVDFINVMAYDGGDGERHSSYPFAVDCGTYWKEMRGLSASKVVLGLPFYARPGWADYGTILESVPDAWSRDHALYNGMEVCYNGVDTIAKKTSYAKENLGGVMIWELTKDAAGKDKSLLQAVKAAALHQD